MNHSRLRPFARGFALALIGVAAPLSGGVDAGNHHHKTVILVPVQPTTTVQVVPVQTAAAPILVLPVAAAPVSLFQTAAAPVFVPMTPVAAAAPPQAAAAPPQVAAAPSAGQVIQVNYGGVLISATVNGSTGAAPGAAGAAPPAGGLPAEKGDRIVAKLKEFDATYQGLGVGVDVRRPTLRTRAATLYATETGKDVSDLDAADYTTINALVARTLNEAPATTPDKTNPPATTTTTPAAAATSILVAPAPASQFQLFLPVKVKHHPLHHSTTYVY